MTPRQHLALRAIALGVIVALAMVPRGPWQKGHARGAAAHAPADEPAAMIANR